MSDVPSLKTRKGRSSSLHLPKQCDPIPIPPSLANSPHLSSPYSIFRRKSIPKTPSREHDEWLRDMVPLDNDNASLGERLTGRSSTAIYVPKWDTSHDSGPPLPPDISLQSLTVASPRHHLHRPWSSPSTPYLIPADLRHCDHLDIQGARF